MKKIWIASLALAMTFFEDRKKTPMQQKWMAVKCAVAPFAIKAFDADGTVAGYASVFGVLDAQREVVAKGAFLRSLAGMKKKQQQPPMLWMHDAAQPVGVWSKLAEDARGLYVEGQLALRTAQGGEAYELLKMGAVTGLSIGYRTVASRMDARERIRTLLDVELLEVSLVTFPANADARVTTVKQKIREDDMQAIIARLKRTACVLTRT